MLLLVTIWVATGSIFSQEIWLLNQNYPGGPTAYEEASASDIYIVVAGAGILILQQMTDRLMVYRCRIVWDSRRAIIIPSILWLATLGLGILMVWRSTMSQTFTCNGNAAELGLAYYTISVLLHVTLTDYASPYFSMIKLFVESALPYTLTGIALPISFGVGSQTEMAFLRVYLSMTCISPQLLILRVTDGSAWQKDTIKLPESVIVFSPDHGDTSGSGCFDGTVTRSDRCRACTIRSRVRIARSELNVSHSKPWW
ncbi:hypothetical protein HD554DRAFT_758905 [Boletus coccyginus]|nr:hypothetical protein HD554DRAFT_758905 [Boletus coccyginus]